MMVGIPWACAMWAPFAIISEELALSTTDEDEDDGDVGIGDVQGKKIASGKGSVGATMGLHNIAIAAPQIVAAVACSVLFKVFEIFGVENGFGWVLRIAGLASVGCLWCGRGLR
jgi:solute carrier family 45 protein 1/2/4